MPIRQGDPRESGLGRATGRDCGVPGGGIFWRGREPGRLEGWLEEAILWRDRRGAVLENRPILLATGWSEVRVS